MHVQACEATHVSGEQSGESVLDLRMACLLETLDELRALTDLSARENRERFSRAVTATSNLTPLGRAPTSPPFDPPFRRRARRPPRDTVESLRRGLRDALALEEGPTICTR